MDRRCPFFRCTPAISMQSRRNAPRKAATALPGDLDARWGRRRGPGHATATGGCRNPRAGRLRQIFKTKAEPQRIVATGPLCRVQHPVSYSSRLQGIHLAGSGNCGRSRLVRYGGAWLPPRGWYRLPSGMDSNLEAFLYYRDPNGTVAGPIYLQNWRFSRVLYIH